MKFGTVINCTDGRVQYPVLDYLKKTSNIDFFDSANEAGPLRTLTKNSDKCRLITLKEQIRTSLEEHGSRFIALVGHHDCTDNPGSRAFQEEQMDVSLDYLQRAFGTEITYVGLYVNEHWEVEEYTRLEPEWQDQRADEMKKLVVLTGAGMSAESGLRTFREMGGLWEEHDVQEVASPGGWHRDRAMVLRFYNERRKQLLETHPNQGHLDLVELEKNFEVWIVTQNVDDLHERAGSKSILHLHGELRKSRSTADPDLVYDIDGWELKEGDLCEKGSQLRPHVVWFGEAVPAIEEAASVVSQADVFVIIGTSMNVYPAAGLINYVPEHASIYIIDPNEVPVAGHPRIRVIRNKAGEGVHKLMEELRDAR